MEASLARQHRVVFSEAIMMVHLEYVFNDQLQSFSSPFIFHTMTR
jgi:hypothetical protein